MVLADDEPTEQRSWPRRWQDLRSCRWRAGGRVALLKARSSLERRRRESLHPRAAGTFFKRDLNSFSGLTVISFPLLTLSYSSGSSGSATCLTPPCYQFQPPATALFLCPFRTVSGSALPLYAFRAAPWTGRSRSGRYRQWVLRRMLVERVPVRRSGTFGDGWRVPGS